MDHRAVRLALGLTIAGASMLAAGVAIWLVTAVGRVASGLAARDLRLAALVLLAGGAACGLAMGFTLTAAGRARSVRPHGQSATTGDVPGLPGPGPSLPEPRSLMNPPPPRPPPPAPGAGPLTAGPLTAGLLTAGLLTAARLATAAAGGGQSEREKAGEPLPGDPEPAARVWWRAPNSPAGSGDDTSEEWLRSLRGPGTQQPPPHSAE